MSAPVGTAVVEDARTKVTLVVNDDEVSTQVFAAVDGRHVLVKLETGQTFIGIETRFAWRYTRLANLIDPVSELNG